MLTKERLEAIGPRGGACIIVRTSEGIDTSNLSGRASLPGLASYRLATGERLNPTDDPKVFQTLDRAREFKLR
ncbi:MAG: hypothetical protein JF606_23595 [Burkholderiales bacterium]|nr:hypothetical protein [Burkholderiales bacterium]